MLITYFKKLATQKTLLNNNEYPMVEYTPMGCSEAEIEALEKKFDVRFPQVYREYLFLMGREHKLYWPGVEYSIELLGEMQQQAQEMLVEEGCSLDHEFWVVDMMWNDQFHFFYFKDGHNPSVYHWLGSDEKTSNGYSNGLAKTADHFSVFIKEMLPTRGERFIDNWMKGTRKIRKIFSRF